MKKYYAVKIGRIPGIYESWEEAKKQVNKYPGNQHKSFKYLYQAIEYLGTNDELIAKYMNI